jgi:hypothetical protein
MNAAAATAVRNLVRDLLHETYNSPRTSMHLQIFRQRPGFREASSHRRDINNINNNNIST